MFKTKMFIGASMLACILTANAQSTATPGTNAPKGQPDPARFAEHKQKVLTRIQSHQQIIQTLQSCVQAANDHAAIKACEKTAHENMPHHGREGMHHDGPKSK
ncbi:MAG: hypothetical protein V4568_04095 [Pseudomonadota bacterium]